MTNSTSLKADIAWLAEHGMEIDRQYAGKWIAVHAGGVVGVGDTAKQAADQARLVCQDGEFILEAVTPDADVNYGGV
jgi:peptide subunit release factor RF-3